MSARSSSFTKAAAVLGVLALSGCGARQDTKADATGAAKQDPAQPTVEAPPEPATPEPDAAEPATPEPDAAEPAPPEPVAIGPSAGPGFELGAKPESNTKAEGTVENVEPLTHAGATVSVGPHLIATADEDSEPTLLMRVRIEFEGVDAAQGLNHEQTIGSSYCENLAFELMDRGTLDDGRWLVDAQLECRAGEDHMQTTTTHSLIVVDPVARSAGLLWTGADSVSSAMGVCDKSSTHSFEIAGQELVLSKTEVVDYDAQMAADYGLDADELECVAKPKQTAVVERIKLASK